MGASAHVMRKLHNGGYIVHSGVAGTQPIQIPQGWDYAEAQSPSTAYNYGLIFRFDYYDVSGWEMNRDTIFPQNYFVQDVGLLAAGATATPAVERAEMLVTKVPRLSDIQIVGEFNWHLPGTPLSRFGLEEVISGQFSRYLASQTENNLVAAGASGWGTAEATAGGKIFIIRAFKFLLGGSGLDFSIPDTGLVAPIMVTSEKTLVHNMRLKRSYDLQG